MTIDRAKGDQRGEGALVGVERAADSDLDVLKAFDDWRRLRDDVDHRAPLFVSRRRNGVPSGQRRRRPAQGDEAPAAFQAGDDRRLSARAGHLGDRRHRPRLRKLRRGVIRPEDDRFRHLLAVKSSRSILRH